MAADALMDDDKQEAVAALMLKLRARDEVSAEEERAVRKAISEIRSYDANRPIVRAGTTRTDCNLLLDGFVARYKDLADGQRQILELHVVGDFVDLHSLLLKQLDHHVGALTPVRIAVFPHEAMREITRDHPHLTRLLWLSTLIDSAIHREKILTVGRRTAIARVGHVLAELFLRLQTVDLTTGLSFKLPITQLDLADATGLTAVHVNRMLKELRDGGILTFRNGEVVIHDWERLQRMAEFDPAYLHIDRQPR
jgi:CRP-like cAMP-binding protein